MSSLECAYADIRRAIVATLFEPLICFCTLQVLILLDLSNIDTRIRRIKSLLVYDQFLEDFSILVYLC